MPVWITIISRHVTLLIINSQTLVMLYDTVKTRLTLDELMILKSLYRTRNSNVKVTVMVAR